jgi:hypothetical protein
MEIDKFVHIIRHAATAEQVDDNTFRILYGAGKYAIVTVYLENTVPKRRRCICRYPIETTSTENLCGNCGLPRR